MTREVSIGVDVAEARKGLDVVAIDTDREIVEVRRKAAAADVRAMAEALDPSVICIDSPPAWAASGKSRTAERALRPYGITAYSTPTDPGDHPFYRWMRAGFAVFDAVADRYPRYRGGDVSRTATEVFPHATAVLLAGRFGGTEPKGRFRRRVLADHGVDARSLPNIDSVDAALAALTGVIALERHHSWVGDPSEGVVLLPVPTPFEPRHPDPASRPERPARSVASPPLVTVGGERPCECGCGARVRRRFLPGHDAKLKSQLLGSMRAGDESAEGRLRELGWR